MPAPKKAAAAKKTKPAKPRPKAKPKPAQKRKPRTQRGGDGDCTSSDGVPLSSVFVSSMPARIPFGAPIASDAVDAGVLGRTPVMYSPSGLLDVRTDLRAFPPAGGPVAPGFNLGLLSGGGSRRRRGG